MDTITVNISMPRGLYDQAKKRAKRYHYTGVSELIRDALRWWLDDRLTRNGFTPEFEEEVLRSEQEAAAGNVVEWDGKGSFTDFVLSHPFPENVKSKVRQKVSGQSKNSAPGLSRIKRGRRATGVVV